MTPSPPRRVRFRDGDDRRHRAQEANGSFGVERLGIPRPAPWRVYARHREGSLDAAVERLRLRNLAISFGILALLCGAAVLLVQTTRRAQALARQQLDFVAGLTHELHTPLAAIESASSNLADGVVARPEKVREYGTIIGREGRRLSQLVDQALELAGVRSGHRVLEREPVVVADLFAKTIDDHRHLIEESGVELATRLEPDLPPVLGDEGALRRVMGNLLHNALKYGGHEIVLAARSEPGEPPRVALEVADVGNGLREAELGRIFEPYFRGSASREGATPGSGLGLHLARELCRRLGGDISAANREQGGASFTVTLPAAGRRPAAGATS